MNDVSGGHDNRVEIPLSALAVKAWFETEEQAREVVPEIHKFLEEGNDPFMWRGHSHTRPPAGCMPSYLDTFAISKKRRENKHWTPCPCCWSETPKFGVGKIAWFPEEHVIRMIGPDCFKSLSPEGHEQASKRLKEERERKRNIEFLLSKLPKVSGVIKVANDVLEVAEAVEEFHKEFHEKLTLDRYDLWSELRPDGELRISEWVETLKLGPDGTMRKETVESRKTHARINGYRMADPSLAKKSGRIHAALKRLRPFEFSDDFQVHIDAMTDDCKKKSASSIEHAVQTVRNVVGELRDLQRFCEKSTVNTLRTWGGMSGCQSPHNFEHAGTRITFGRSDSAKYAVRIPQGMLTRIPDVDF